MILWGFITQFLVGQSGWVAQAAGVFLSAVLLWDTLFRGQLGVSMCFLEEMYARHLGHLFVSPLRPGELVVANFLVSLMRVPDRRRRCRDPGLPDLPLLADRHAGLGVIPFFAVMMLFGWAIGADHRRPGHPPGPGGREPGLGRHLLHPALLRRLLPGRDPAALGPLDRVPAALGPGVRGHAGGPGRAPLRLAPCSARRSPCCWSGWLPAAIAFTLLFHERAPARAAAAERRVADGVAPKATAGP